MNISSPDIETLFRKRIRQQGDSLTDFIKRTDLSRSYLYNLMAGNVADPGVKTLYKLAKALNLPSVAMFRLFQTPEHEPKNFNDEHTALINPNDRCMMAGDLNYPAFSMVLPGESFTKQWAIQNSGSVPWKNRRLRRVDSEVVISVRDTSGFLSELNTAQLRCAHTSVEIPDALPGETVVVSVNFVAPIEQASVATLWRIDDAQGKHVYPRSFFLKTVVTVVGD